MKARTRLRRLGSMVWLSSLLGVISMAHGDTKNDYPPPVPPKDPAALGVNIQRTMTLLATSTPQHRNHVRILFYGQSITEQEWSKKVADDLRKRFPNADLEIENRAIGGFASQLLIRPAEHDLYPFYPDLLIFHVYGANQEYEQIIKSVRTRTTAEVLMQRDHVTQMPPAVIDREKDKGMWWDDLMNNHLLPDIAKKYGCGLADVRGGWLDYLNANHLEPKTLLKDGVHLNDYGNYLMAELVKRNLVYRPELPKETWQSLVRTVEVGKEARWQNGKLVLEFEGNRVDLLPDTAAAKSGSLQVRIDGKKPSTFADALRITRPQPGPWSPLFVSRVDHTSPLLPEEWTMKITSVSEDSTKWTFDVIGSVTGADGSGDNSTVFTSKSGRVKIEPASFFRNGKVPVGYEIKWRVLPMYLDAYTTPKITDPSLEYAATAVQGIANTKHTLELTSEPGSVPALKAIRVYRPPMH